MYNTAQREILFQKLIQKTEELGRKVKSAEFAADEGVIEANKFAYYYGSFDKAAEEAWAKVRLREQKPQTEHASGGMEVNQMSKKKHLQLSDERKRNLIDEFVEMYIKNDGRMPPNRMIKKNPYVTEEEINILRKANELAEPKIRRLAEQKTGKKFLSDQERRAQEMRARYAYEIKSKTEPETESEDENLTSQNNEQAEPVKELEPEVETMEMPKEPELEVKKRMGGRGHTVDKETVLEDLRAITERLGRLPTMAELKDPENGASFACQTYVNKLGSKPDWARLLGMEYTGTRGGRKAKQVEPETTKMDEVESEVTESESVVEEQVKPETIQPEPETTTEVVEEKFETVAEVVEDAEDTAEVMETVMVEVPIKLIIPKGIRGSVTVTLELND